MPSSSPAVERVKPLLGTLVSVRAAGADAERLQDAVDAAFDEIALIHRLMSFHQPDSEVSLLNRAAHRAPVTVHPHTAAVLRLACEMSAESDGAFDVTVAPELARRGLLPEPDAAEMPDAAVDWRDILLDGETASFRRPLWIDLGGIAKGYAVDRAIESLRRNGVEQGCVNAGGDLRLFGPEPEWVALRTDLQEDGDQPAILLREGSLAGSGGPSSRRGPHVDPRRRQRVGSARFACVAAESCAVADALTKVVLAAGRRAEPTLRRFSAEAHFYDRRWGWRHLGGSA